METEKSLNGSTPHESVVFCGRADRARSVVGFIRRRRLLPRSLLCKKRTIMFIKTKLADHRWFQSFFFRGSRGSAPRWSVVFHRSLHSQFCVRRRIRVAVFQKQQKVKPHKFTNQSPVRPHICQQGEATPTFENVTLDHKNLNKAKAHTQQKNMFVVSCRALTAEPCGEQVLTFSTNSCRWSIVNFGCRNLPRLVRTVNDHSWIYHKLIRKSPPKTEINRNTHSKDRSLKTILTTQESQGREKRLKTNQAWKLCKEERVRTAPRKCFNSRSQGKILLKRNSNLNF